MDHRIRSGSLQFYPRKRVRKVLPSVNWDNIHLRTKSEKTNLSGFLGYKVGMTSVYVKDNSADSMMKNKRIVIPATIIECPSLKIYSVRFYNEKKLKKDFVVGFDSELLSKLRKPKQLKKIENINFTYDEVRVIVYSEVKKTGIKKTPDLFEVSLSGNKDEQLKFVNEKIGKEISVADVFSKVNLVDIRGTTKGKGLQGPVKRFGISLKAYKSEKGQRRPGSLAPWHPARVTFRAPQAGQLGFFHRISYNSNVLKIGKISEENINKKQGFHKFGNIKTDYIIVRGSIPGTKKRAILMTPSFRPTKHTSKRSFEFIELR